MEGDKNKVFRLQGKVQHYHWGGNSFLPAFLHIPNPEKKPFAEYWMGAHDQASADIIDSHQKMIGLNHYIRDFPRETLGEKAASEFGQLPYLLKVLDVKDMLSIQVHPTKESAEQAFNEESRSGLSIADARRNYKDDNHKPELMLALSEFWLLHGFKRRSSLEQTLQKVPELQFLVNTFTHGGYEGLYRKVMEMPQEGIDEALGSLLNRIIPAYQKNLLLKNDEHFWAARAALTFNKEKHIDRGIFSIYFFNLLNLHPGEAIFQDAGVPHAYLEGQNIEIMANSDNVLRGGLTSKHIDVRELMHHIKFEETVPEIIHGQKATEHELVFLTPAPDFELSLVILEQGETISSASSATEIFLLMEGEADVYENDKNRLLIKKGEAFVSFNEALIDIHALKKSVICKASVPS